MIERLKNQALTGGLLLAVFLAYHFPEAGASGGWLHTEFTTDLAIGLIFLLQGLTLNSKALRASVFNVRLHVFCQSWIFILSPALMLGLVALAGRWIPDSIQPGLFFLSVLPTTILSSTVFTAVSEGDAAAALFNATLANLIGVVATPLWCLFLFSSTSGQFPPVGSLIAKIALYILLPTLLGQLLRGLFGNRITPWKTAIKRFNNTLILFVVYAAFSNSFAQGVWDGFGFNTIATAFVCAAAYLALLSALVWSSSRISSSRMSDRIAAFYCGSQKTLAAGVPMAAVIFDGQSGALAASVIILPLMVFHVMQLFLSGVISGQLKSLAEANRGSSEETV